MNRVKFFLAVVATTLVFASCGTEQTSFVSIAEAEGIIPGTWKVNYYGDDSGISGDEFADYTFTFNEDGTVTAVSGTETFSGTWLIQVSTDDVYDEEMVLTIDKLDALNQTWYFQNMTEVRMELIEGGSTEQIHFLKIDSE